MVGRNQQKLNDLVVSLRKVTEAPLETFQLDLANYGTPEDMLRVLSDLMIRADDLGASMFIYNAGIAQMSSIEDSSAETLRKEMVDSFSPTATYAIAFVHVALAAMIRRYRENPRYSGRLLVTSSVSDVCPCAQVRIYSAAKAALSVYCAGAQQELHDMGLDKHISVTILRPGPVETPFFDNVADSNLTGLSRVRGVV